MFIEKLCLSHWYLVLFLIAITGVEVNAADAIDLGSHVSNADLIYETPAERTEGAMPVGNGTMGTLVWTTPAAFHMQINRVDVYGNDSTTNSFNRNQDYCGGCAFIDIELLNYGEAVFEKPHYHQQVHVYDGAMSLQGKGVSARIIAHPHSDVIAIEIDDQRAEPQPIRINLRKLRYVNKYEADINDDLTRENSSLLHNKSHTAKSTLHEIKPTAGDGSDIMLTQHYTEGGYQCSSAVSIAVLGRKAQTRITNPSTITLTSEPKQGPMVILVSSSAAFSEPGPVGQLALATLESAKSKGFESLSDETKAWWHDFWTRSYVHLSSDDGQAELVEKHFTWWLYLMGSASRGSLPMKYNGMLWNSNGDRRMWGSQHWWHNLSMYYRALHAANHAELAKPLFDMYHGMYESAALSAQQMWGSQGIFIGETVFFDGLPALPDDIAEEMRELYLFRKPWSEVSERFIEFASTKHPQNSRWNWKSVGRYVDGKWVYETKPDPPNGHVVHLFGSQAQLANQYWVAYQHSGDEAFLREQGYPMIKGALEFFLHYPHFKKGEDGKWHFRRANHREGLRDVTDPMGCMASLHALLPIAIKAGEVLGVDPERREAWKQIYIDLAPMPHSGLDNASMKSGPGEPAFWLTGLEAIGIGEAKPSIHPAEFLDLVSMETSVTNPGRFQRAIDSFKRAHPDGVDENIEVNVLGLQAVASARLGLADAARKYIYNQITNPYNNYCDWDSVGPPLVLPNRMTLREGPGALGAQRLGNAAYALTEALMQSVPGSPGGESVIRLFPAMPPQWDAQFKLHARGGFMVEASINDGKIGQVKITSQQGETLRLRNPWPGRKVSAQYKAGDAIEMGGTLLELSTKQNDVILFTVIN